MTLLFISISPMMERLFKNILQQPTFGIHFSEFHDN